MGCGGSDERRLVQEELHLGPDDAVQRLAEEADGAPDDVDQLILDLGDELRRSLALGVHQRGAGQVERQEARDRIGEGAVVPDAGGVVARDHAAQAEPEPAVAHAASREVIVERDLDVAEQRLDQRAVDVRRDEPGDQTLRVVLRRRVGARLRQRQRAHRRVDAPGHEVRLGERARYRPPRVEQIVRPAHRP